MVVLFLFIYLRNLINDPGSGCAVFFFFLLECVMVPFVLGFLHDSYSDWGQMTSLICIHDLGLPEEKIWITLETQEQAKSL